MKKCLHALVGLILYASISLSSSAYAVLFSHEHVIANMFNKECAIEIENGIGFNIRPSDYPYLQKWPRSSRLNITTYSPWFWSTYKYQIVNQATGESAFAELSRPAIDNDPNNHRLIKKDVLTGMLTIALQGSFTANAYQTGTEENFQTTSSEGRELIKKWERFDNILVVQNGDWLRYGCDYALVNTSLEPEEVVKVCKLASK